MVCHERDAMDRNVFLFGNKKNLSDSYHAEGSNEIWCGSLGPCSGHAGAITAVKHLKNSELNLSVRILRIKSMSPTCHRS